MTTMARRDSESGLTLIEVLVALGIVAMAIGLALPMLQRGSSPLQASSAAREIVAALREARTAAITENRAVVFWVDTRAGSFGYGQRRYSLLAQNGGAPLTLMLYTTEEQQGRGADDRRETGTIRFFPGGGSTGGGVSVRDSRRQIMVSIDWLSGQIRTAESLVPASSRGLAHAAR